MENQQRQARLKRKMTMSNKKQRTINIQRENLPITEQENVAFQTTSDNITPPRCLNIGTPGIGVIGNSNFSMFKSSIGNRTSISRAPMRDLSNLPMTTSSSNPSQHLEHLKRKYVHTDENRLTGTINISDQRLNLSHTTNVNSMSTLGNSIHNSSKAKTRLPMTPLSRHSGNTLRSGNHVIQSGRVIESVTRNMTQEFEGSISCRDDNITESGHRIETGVLNDNVDFMTQEGPKGEYDLPKIDSEGYWDIGDPNWKCEFCGARMWYLERTTKWRNSKKPTFSLCCMNGKVELPLSKSPPQLLSKLLTDKDSKSRHFLEQIRRFNMMFSFTSMGGKIDTSVNKGRGPYSFRLHGQNFHRIGSLLPSTGSAPKFSQLYIYDTQNEVSNRINAVSSESNPNELDNKIVDDLKEMLDEHNNLTKSFRMARDRFDSEECENMKLKLIGRRETDGRRYNLPSESEVAALIIGDIDSLNDERDIVLETQTGLLQRISELHPSYLALQYPLLFPYGEDGYRIDIQHRDKGSNSSSKRKLSMREFFAFKIQERVNEFGTILLSKRLFQQFLVDGYTMIESQRLSFIRHNQKKLRADLYNNLNVAARTGNANPSTMGTRIVLPSSFTGGSRYMIQNYQDAMALCKWYGYPDLFLTFTCNPKWKEITRFVEERGLSPQDRPDILCRVFKMKLDHLIKDLRENHILGRVQAVVYTVEFQKRGLPHAHILLFMHPDDKFPTTDHIDKVICAEIPDKEKDLKLYEAVQEYMIHGPCGLSFKTSPCMKDGKCSKYFPKKFNERTTIDEDGFPEYMRRNTGHTVIKKGVELDNGSVVPYNPTLLMMYQAHINVEWCNQSNSIKYLFKYINKGHDRVTAAICQGQEDGEKETVVDEIKMYYDCRYISPCEAVWRIYCFDIHYRKPSVERLGFHLPGEQSVIFDEDASIESVMNRPKVERSMFMAWMDCNARYENARLLTYAEFPTEFVWNQTDKEWTPRKQGFSIGRIYHVPPGCGERYYLRVLLNIVKGPTCYEEIRKFNGVVYATFKDACYARGLLDDDKEYIDAIVEASFWGSASYLRRLFTTLLHFGCLSMPELIWEKTWHLLGDDILHKQRNILQMPDLQLDDEQLKNYTLAEIEKLLKSHGSSLKNFQSLPFPDLVATSDGCNKLIQDELCYDTSQLLMEHNKLFSSLTLEQKEVYGEIMNAVSQSTGGVFFLYGYGGTGKTFIWKTLSAAIRSKGDIVLNVASSGIAALLLSGGRTAHSRFKIPIIINEDSTCSIKVGSDLAGLLTKAKLIIWDEAPMVHRHCFEALDRTLRDLLRSSNPLSLHQPFGGKTVVFGGDFRQILPVITNGSRQDIVMATINSSYLWNVCKVLKLTRNMRLQVGTDDPNSEEIREFSEWILKVGDGSIGEPNEGEGVIEIPNDILIKEAKDPIASMIDSTYPLITENMWDPEYFQERAILAPTHEVVESVNEKMLSMIPGEEKEYLSSDSICKADKVADINQELYSPEFLNSIRCSGLPNHCLKLKVGVPVMLLRNLDQSAGLCNGTRSIITRIGDRVLKAKIISGTHIGEEWLIPRMLLSPSDSKLPFQFQRRQYPIAVCFAMTINKSQGQSLSHVGLYLPRPVFTHGQLYVAISRVKSKKGLKVLILDKDGQISNCTTNVVYKEVFQNL